MSEGEPGSAARRVLTVGHSNHSIERLVELLRLHAVTAVLDVRSRPYSRFNLVFNREPFAHALAQQRIAYAFLGRELGARPEDPACYEDGRVQYRLLGGTALFQDGLRRTIDEAEGQTVALLCAEKEPLACHRAILVGPALEAAGVSVAHILADGALESSAEAMRRLRRLLKLPDFDLFRSEEELIAAALALQERRIAYNDEASRERED